MSFAKNPAKSYGLWRPNSDFTKFFGDLKKRRIAGSDGNPMVRISNRPPPQTERSKTAPASTPQIAVKHNYSSPSEILVNTARDQTGSITTDASRQTGIKRKATAECSRSDREKKKKKKTGNKRPAKTSAHSSSSSSQAKRKKVKRTASCRLERRLREARL